MLSSEKTKRDVFCERKKYGYLTKAEAKILSEGCESRINHRDAVVVQFLAIQ